MDEITKQLMTVHKTYIREITSTDYMYQENKGEDSNNALTVATYILLRHLAAKIPSQLHNFYLLSFLRDFPHKGTLYSGCH